jgi:Zn finger protein HypA/HybF involved in hydrogenase expression
VPHFRKVERAKAIIENGVELTLKECAKCGAEFYGSKAQIQCENCRTTRKKRVR